MVKKLLTTTDSHFIVIIANEKSLFYLFFFIFFFIGFIWYIRGHLSNGIFQAWALKTFVCGRYRFVTITFPRCGVVLGYVGFRTGDALSWYITVPAP